jgi:phosphoadenosine phosphosulfate reductase
VRGLDDLARSTLADAVERHHPRLVLACSFQKEESVLVHMLTEIVDDPKVFTIDTGVLFPETLATWRAFEERWGLKVDVQEAFGGWTGPENCCSAAKVDALERALAGTDAWITGMRREQAPTRTAVDVVSTDKRGLTKYNPLADWTEKDVWRYISAHDLPYNPLHDQGYASIGCAPCTLPGSGREGRWAGSEKTECGIHV